MSVHISHTALSDGGLAVVMGLMALIAGGASYAMGRDAVKAGGTRSVFLGALLGVMWGPAALPYAGAWGELALVALVACLVHPVWLVVVWLVAPFYLAGAVAVKNRRPRLAGAGPVAALAGIQPHEPDRPWIQRGDALEFDHRFAAGGRMRLGWLVLGGIGAWVEFWVWQTSMAPRPGHEAGGWMMFWSMNAFLGLIGLFFWTAWSQLGLRGFRARFDRASGSWALEHVQRMAGVTEAGDLAEIRDVRAQNVAVKVGEGEVQRPGLVLHLHDGRELPLGFFTSYPGPAANPDETWAALERDAGRLRAFLAQAEAEPRPVRQAVSPPRQAVPPLLQRIGRRQAVLGAGLVLAGLVFAANPRGPNLFPGLVTLVKAPFLSPLDRVLEAHRDGLRNIPGVKAAVFDYQYDLILGQTAPLLTAGIQRLDDAACARFIAANDDLTWGAPARFLVAGKGGRPPLENAEFGPELARVGPKVLRQYFQVQEQAVAAAVNKDHARWGSEAEVKRAWEMFYAGLSPEDADRYRQLPRDGAGASDADLAWAARTYWHRLRRMNHHAASTILRDNVRQQGAAG